MSGIVDGLLPVDKPAGPTSQDVVTIVKRALKATKAGHTGTLDPFATGLLLVCLGRATKLAGWLTAEDKGYRATVALGVATDTDDATGKELSRADASKLTREDVEVALAAFRGKLQQIPPAFSAIQKDGKRAYDAARKGEAVDLEAREVVVHEIELTDFAAGAVASAALTMRVSKGTYVRAIGRDLGRALGVGGHLLALRRTASGLYDVKPALPLAAIKAKPAEARASVIPLDEIKLPMPDLTLTAGEAEKVGHGVPPRRPDLDDGPYRLVGPDGAVLAIAIAAKGRLAIERVL